MEFNYTDSQKTANEPKMKAYIDWCKNNGVIYDKLDFPAIFDGVCGVKANEDI